MLHVRQDSYYLPGDSRRVCAELDGWIRALLHLPCLIGNFGVWRVYNAVLHWQPSHPLISITLIPLHTIKYPIVPIHKLKPSKLSNNKYASRVRPL